LSRSVFCKEGICYQQHPLSSESFQALQSILPEAKLGGKLKLLHHIASFLPIVFPIFRENMSKTEE
jgi:hypothetical protein